MKKNPCKYFHASSFSCSARTEKYTAIPEPQLCHIAKRIDGGKMVSSGFYMASITFYNTVDEVGLRLTECPYCERIWFLDNGEDGHSYIKKTEHPFFELDYFSCGLSVSNGTEKALSLNRKIKIFRFLCSCGYFFISAESSSPEEYLIISDTLLDDFADKLNEKKLDGDFFLGEAHRFGRRMVICPKCGRHWIYASDSKNYTSYVEEDVAEKCELKSIYTVPTPILSTTGLLE